MLLQEHHTPVASGLVGGFLIGLIGIFLPPTMFWGEFEIRTLANPGKVVLPHIWPKGGFYGLSPFLQVSLRPLLLPQYIAGLPLDPRAELLLAVGGPNYRFPAPSRAFSPHVLIPMDGLTCPACFCLAYHRQRQVLQTLPVRSDSGLRSFCMFLL